MVIKMGYKNYDWEVNMKFKGNDDAPDEQELRKIVKEQLAFNGLTLRDKDIEVTEK